MAPGRGRRGRVVARRCGAGRRRPLHVRAGTRRRGDRSSGRRATWRVAATLAGRIFERAAIDVAFAAAPVQAPDQITTSGLLGFAGIDAVEVPTLAIEQHLAEKLHAYTRTYAGGRPSTRVKDLVDAVVIANTSVIGAAMLTEAITVTFKRRAEHAVPAALPEPPVEWATPWRRLARDVPAPDDVTADPSLLRERLSALIVTAISADVIGSRPFTSMMRKGQQAPAAVWPYQERVNEASRTAAADDP